MLAGPPKDYWPPGERWLVHPTLGLASPPFGGLHGLLDQGSGPPRLLDGPDAPSPAGRHIVRPNSARAATRRKRPLWCPAPEQLSSRAPQGGALPVERERTTHRAQHGRNPFPS